MKVYWDKTAVIGLVGFTISLLLILCFMDRLSYPLVGIFLCLFGILLCGIYGALLKAGSPGRKKKRTRRRRRRKMRQEVSMPSACFSAWWSAFSVLSSDSYLS